MANLTLGFWIILAMFLLFFLVVIILSIIYSFQVPEVYDALFRLTDFSITHNGATSMDVVIRNVYQKNVKFDKLATNASINQVVHTVMNSPSFQADHPWEAVARDIGQQIWNDYDIVGVSVELLIPAGNDNVSTATFSKGNVTRILKLDAVS